MGKIELVTAALIIIARPALLLTTAATILLLLVLTRRSTYRVIAVIFPTLISCKTFRLRSPSTSIGRARFLSFAFRAQSESRQFVPAESGNIRNIGWVFFVGVTPSATPPRNEPRICIIHGTFSGSQACFSSAFKNNEDHFLRSVIFFLSDLLASSSFPLLPDLSLDVAPLIYFPWD